MSLRLPIQNPCPKDYEAMPGDAHQRFCDTCGKHVHDISAGTEEQARRLLADNRGRRVCVRFARTSSGEIRFRGAALALVAAASLAACSAADQVTQPTVQVGPLPPAPKKPDAGPPDDIYFVGDVTEP